MRKKTKARTQNQKQTQKEPKNIYYKKETKKSKKVKNKQKKLNVYHQEKM